MGGGSKQKQESRPSAQQTAASNALLAYMLGPNVGLFGGEAKLDDDDIPTFGNYFNTSGQPLSFSSSQPLAAPTTIQSSPYGNISDNAFSFLSGQRPSVGSTFTQENPQLFGDNVQMPSVQAGAGSLPGTIFPDFQEMMDLSGQRFFDTLVGTDAQGNPTVGGEGVNPVFNQALGMITDPQLPSSFSRFASPSFGMFGNIGGGAVPVPEFPQIVSTEAARGAVETLQNQPSIFDNIDGSNPYLDRITEITNQHLDAVGARMDEQRTKQIQAATADLAANGLLSSDQLLRSREEITRRSLDDYALAALDFSRENIMHLSQVALQDAQLNSRNAESILNAALVEKGIEADLAATIAQINANKLIAIQTAQISAAAGLLANTQDAGLALIQMGYQDFVNSQQTQLGTMRLPLDIGLGLATGGPTITQGSTKTKNL